jgi:hypothetical protein
MPAESARLRRRVERHDLRLIAAAGVLGIAAVPLGLAFRGSPHHPPGCVAVSRAGFMGNQTETHCSPTKRTP